MTERDEIRGLFGTHNACYAGHAEHIPFSGHPLKNEIKGLLLHGDIAAGDRCAAGDRLVTDIHHMGITGGIKVGKLAHYSGSIGGEFMP